MPIGMQWGSEGKGAISSYFAPVASIAIRTGSANAAHTTYYEGCRYVVWMLPAAWMNPGTMLVIGRGAIIDLPMLLDEIERFHRVVPLKYRLLVDRSAHVVTDPQRQREQAAQLANRIASTSGRLNLGISEARADKVRRSAECLLAKDVPALQPYLADTVDYVNVKLGAGAFVLLDATQGFGLSLDHGSFPYVTSHDTSASALAASTTSR